MVYHWSSTASRTPPDRPASGFTLFFFLFFFLCVAYFSPSRFSFSLAFLVSLWSASAHQITSRYNSKTLSSHTNTQELLFFFFFCLACVCKLCAFLCVSRSVELRLNQLFTQPFHIDTQTQYSTQKPQLHSCKHTFFAHTKKKRSHT